MWVFLLHSLWGGAVSSCPTLWGLAAPPRSLRSYFCLSWALLSLTTCRPGGTQLTWPVFLGINSRKGKDQPLLGFFGLVYISH